MTELIERYVHQVGRYLPPKERADIEAELRSLIQDMLDDRYPETPSQADVASVLAELGDPRRVATSYHKEQYLIGPSLYPWMMMVMRYGWLVVPMVMIFLSVFGVLISSQPPTVFNLLLEPIWASLQATFIFSAVVVLIFALIQHFDLEFDANTPFNALELPQIDDPRVVDRFKSVSGTALGTFFVLVFLYFLAVGGLTLRFNLSDPGDVIASPVGWMIVLVVAIIIMTVINIIALWRNTWTGSLLLTQTILEILGNIAMYFSVYMPVYQRIIADNSALSDVPLPEIIVILYAVITLV
ncbi:MAG: hypothetical protein SH821_15135, partial [Phototrophicales bacterium]|nr:hypothetical protein [Phototrophicales bacterium]